MNDEIMLPLAVKKQIDAVCTKFERAWRAGDSPKLGPFIDKLDPAIRHPLLAELVLTELALREERGDLAPMDGIVSANPELKDEILRAVQQSAECESSAGHPNSLVDTAQHIQDPVASSVKDAGASKANTQRPNPNKIGRYEVQRLLGEGAFGKVYLAYDGQLERNVAIKVPLRNALARADDVKQFIDEARLLAKLDHPSIVPVFDVGQIDARQCFVVSKYIEGTDLRRRLQGNHFTPRQAAELIAVVADALHHAHRQRIIHRDIKPANILLDASDKPYVADFGLALKHEDYGKQPGYAGTLVYMSPEQARGESHLVDARSDIFGLGVVLYELLTGCLPFQGDNWHEVTDRIKNSVVRPPRQLVDTIARELERICLKALAKRATDRYLTAKDLATDLQEFLAVAPALPGNLRKATKIVPKGLRSFDVHDADFFLELLPGPRDRDGVPESIRFWKTRIEEADADKTFRVGLLYGPSGCGKSSLIKAGLLPRLSPDVLSITIEASAVDTELRCIKALQKNFPEFSENASLPDLIADLRKGRGSGRTKVLLVLDQFEQWLHANKSAQDSQLVMALRQCDGGNVQCLLLVRDDFWMSATRFMNALEVPLLELQNSAAVDLFDLEHACKVLATFGRAYDKLPDLPIEPSKEQLRFLKHAVEGLADEGKVICVRLAVFAEMMKGRPWTSESLQQVGGTEGIGVTFLDETFSAKHAPPTYRLHQPAIRAVLGALLPHQGSEIKGQMKSFDELLEVSRYRKRPADFDLLLNILDNQLRLITPTELDDTESDELEIEATSPATNLSQYYQLTHDFLVPSLRGWLKRKQSESHRGRAELRLSERSAMWIAKPENRHLPSLLEYSCIRVLTRKQQWTDPQRRMMQRADRFHGIRVATAAMLFLVLAAAIYEVRGRIGAGFFIRSVKNAEIGSLRSIVEEGAAYRSWAEERLRRVLSDPSATPGQRLNASLALLSTDRQQLSELRERLLDCSIDELSVIIGFLYNHRDELVPPLWQTFRDEHSPLQHRFHAGVALAEFSPSDSAWTDSDAVFLVEELVSANPDDWRTLRALLARIKKKLHSPLRLHFGDETATDTVRDAAAAALADYLADDPSKLAVLAASATASQYRFLIEKLQQHSTEPNSAKTVLTRLAKQQPAESFDETVRLPLGQLRANAAITLMRLEHVAEAFAALNVENDPESITQFVHRCRRWGVTPEQLATALEKASDVHARFAVLLALGDYSLQEISEPNRERLKARIVGWYQSDPSSAIHGACGWLLRTWGVGDEVRRIDQTPVAYDPSGKREWYVQVIEVPAPGFSGLLGKTQNVHFTFIVIPPGEYKMGSPTDEWNRKVDETEHQVVLKYPIAISDREITWKQFDPFDLGGHRALFEGQGSSKLAEQEAAFGIRWFEAVNYCRWLTQQHPEMTESDQCYDATLPSQIQPLVDLPDTTDWPLLSDFTDRRGFRLPTEAEWEYACRGGMKTAFSFGQDREMLGHYAWFQENSSDYSPAVGLLRPNLHGLFDMHGKLNEWCHDWYWPYEDAVDPAGPKWGVKRVVRGGSWRDSSEYLRSSSRAAYGPSERSGDVGFRVVQVPSAAKPKNRNQSRVPQP